MSEPRDYGDRDTHAPPEGYVQALETITHDDNEPSEDQPRYLMTEDEYPRLTRAMNHVRADQGGPSWAARKSAVIHQRWQEHLPAMELAVGSLSEQYPAPEDREASEAFLRGEALSYIDTELYSFCCGEYDLMRAIAARSDALLMASNFLSDFAEGWSFYDEDDVFDPLRPYGEGEVVT